MSARNEGDLFEYGNGWLLESPYEDPYFILNPPNQEPEQVVPTINLPEQVVPVYNPMEPLNDLNTAINNSEASDANNYVISSYPWENLYWEQEVTSLPHMAHPFPETMLGATSSVVGENFANPTGLTQADFNVLLDQITESNHQCAIAQEEAHRTRLYIVTVEDELRESRKETERAHQLLNQTQAQVVRLQEELAYANHVIRNSFARDYRLPAQRRHRRN